MNITLNLSLPSAVDSTLEEETSFWTEFCRNLKSTAGVSMLVTLIIAPVLNIFYIAVTLKSPKLNNLRSYLPVGLSISNIAAVISLFLNIVVQSYYRESYHMSETLFGVIFAEMWQSLMMVCIAVERYIAVLHPFLYPIWINKRLLILAIVITGIISLCIASLVFIIPSPSLLESAIAVFSQKRKISLGDLYGYGTTIFLQAWLTIHIVLGIGMIGLYIPVLVSIRAQRKKIQAQSIQGPTGQNDTFQNQKGTIILCIVMLYHFVVWMPSLLLNTVPQLLYAPLEGEELKNYSIGVGILVYTPPMIYPLLYGMANTSFRRELFKCCGIKRYMSEDEPWITEYIHTT